MSRAAEEAVARYVRNMRVVFGEPEGGQAEPEPPPTDGGEDSARKLPAEEAQTE